MEDKSLELETAIKAALEAGKVLEKYFETEILRETKDDDSIVTQADKECEEIIKKIISGRFPKHSILGEETGMTENGSDCVWHIDPIDGTRNFANGIPLFAISIALVCGKDLKVGVIHNPNLNALFYAEKDKGAYWNHNKMHVSKDDAKHGIVTITSGRKENDLKIRRNLMSDTILQLIDVKKHYPIHGGIFFRQIATVYAVDGVSLDIKKGETLYFLRILYY